MKIGQTIIVIGNLFTELHCLTYNEQYIVLPLKGIRRRKIYFIFVFIYIICWKYDFDKYCTHLHQSSCFKFLRTMQRRINDVYIINISIPIIIIIINIQKSTI